MQIKRIVASVMTGVILCSGVLGFSNPNKVNADIIPEVGISYASPDVANMVGIQQFVTRLYNVCLNRNPDTNGLNDWCNRLAQHEATGCSAAYGFIFSSEFQNNNYSNEQYITYMYSAFFGRSPDPAGFNDWVNRLNNGTTRESVFCGFANSNEFASLCKDYGIVRGFHIEGQNYSQVAMVNLFVERLYNVVLERSCDEIGMADWTNQLVAHTNSGCGVAYGFVFSQEFINKNYCNEHYVETLYKAFMGRPSDSAGKADWVNQLNSGVSREQVFNGFAGSQEFIGICASYGIESGSITITGNGTHANGVCSLCGTNNSGFNPGTNSGGNSGSIPGTNIGTNPGTNPGVNPGTNPGTIPSDTGVNPLDYTYEVYPVLNGFNRYFYVKTANPDPYSFRLSDPSSIYADDSEDSTQYLSLFNRVFADVLYEDESTYRVSGGYIFVSDGSRGVDGGDFILQSIENRSFSTMTTITGSGSYVTLVNNSTYADTDRHISCPAVRDNVDYLINTFTTPNMDYFEKLNAVQSGLQTLAVYPRGLADDSGTARYPALAASPYIELSLNKHCNIYPSSGMPMLLSYVYPFVADSLGFPGLMGAVAKRLDSSAVVSSGDLHYLIEVTYNGTTRTYGGAGTGGYNDVYLSQISKLFTFNGSSSDMFGNATIASLREQYLEYSRLGSQNAQAASDSLNYRTVFEGTNGGWIRVAREGLLGGSTGHYSYIYLEPQWNGYAVASNMWIDGYYVSSYELAVITTLDDTLENNPRIAITDYSYTNTRGQSRNETIVYSYDATYQVWASAWLLNQKYGIRNYSLADYASLPDDAIITMDEARAMNLASPTDPPSHGYIFDGTAEPGTPF